MKADHRRSHRFNLQMIVKLVKSDFDLGDAFTSDISRGGAFVVLPFSRQPLSNTFSLKILHNEKNKDPILVKSMVVHRSDEGMGVMFGRDLTELFEMTANHRQVDPG